MDCCRVSKLVNNVKKRFAGMFDPGMNAVWERMKVFQNDALVRFIEECRNLK